MQSVVNVVHRSTHTWRTKFSKREREKMSFSTWRSIDKKQQWQSISEITGAQARSLVLRACLDVRELFLAWDVRANIVRQRREVQRNRHSSRPRPHPCSTLSQRSANLLDPTIDRFSIDLPKTTTTTRARATERDVAMFFSRWMPLALGDGRRVSLVCRQGSCLEQEVRCASLSEERREVSLEEHWSVSTVFQMCGERRLSTDEKDAASIPRIDWSSPTVDFAEDCVDEVQEESMSARKRVHLFLSLDKQTNKSLIQRILLLLFRSLTSWFKTNLCVFRSFLQFDVLTQER